MLFLFSFNPTAPTEIYTLSLHDALPISMAQSLRSADERARVRSDGFCAAISMASDPGRSEEHTSELQSRFDLVCRLLLEKKNDLTRRDITADFQGDAGSRI